MSKAKVTATLGLRLRKKPWGTVLTVMPYNSLVEVIEKQPLWWKVNYNSIVGWSYSKWLMELPDSEYEIGIDISSWNKVDFAKLAKPDFTIIRGAYGVGLVDKYFGERLIELRRREFPLGVYFVFQPWVKGNLQAEFIKKLYCQHEKEFVAIDVEVIRNSPPYSKLEAANNLRELLLNLHYNDIYIYTSKYMWQEVIGNYHRDFFGKYKLWVAYYGKNLTEDLLPSPWNDWNIWQFTEKGKWQGIRGNVDLNYRK